MLSCVIVYKKETQQEEKNVIAAVRWYQSIPNAEIIVVEQGSENSLEGKLPPDVQHIFLVNAHASDPCWFSFDPYWAFNVGFIHADHNLVLFTDWNTLIKHDDLQSALNQMNYYQVVSFSKSTPLNKQAPKDHESDGPVLAKKVSLLRIGGWPEKSGDLSYQIFLLKVKRMGLKYAVLNYPRFHLQSRLPQYPENHDLYEAIKTMSTSQLQFYFFCSTMSIGRVNRYQCDHDDLITMTIDWNTNLYHLFGDLWKYVLNLTVNDHVRELILTRAKDLKLQYPRWAVTGMNR